MAPEPHDRGLLFLDIDGVLNPETWTLDGDWRTVTVGRHEIWVSDELSQWLGTLIEHGVEIVWATTWIEAPTHLVELAGHVGLPIDLARIDRLEWGADDGDECGKLPGVRRWLEQHAIDPRSVPVAWVDDLLGVRDCDWADELGIHAIKVPSAVGLSDLGQRQRIEDTLGLSCNQSAGVLGK